MNLTKIFLIYFLVFIFLTNCTKQEKISLIEEEDVEMQMVQALTFFLNQQQVHFQTGILLTLSNTEQDSLL